MNEKNLTQRLDLVRRDSGLRPGLIDFFGEWLRGAPDEELFRVDVPTWAERHGVSEDEALDLFLHAATAGVFSLAWGTICPSCGMLIWTPGGLRALGPNPHCNLCRADFPAAADDRVEVTFGLEPGIRRLRFHEPDGIDPMRDARVLFFGPTHEALDPRASIGNMMKAARGVAPASTTEIDVTLAAGMAAVIVPDVHAVAFVQIGPDLGSETSFELHDGALLPAQAGLRPGRVRIHVTNRTRHDVTACAVQLPSLEAQAQSMGAPPAFRVRPFLTGKRLLTCQTFRDLFRTETIGDKGLSITSLAMVFTDLQASTALYERVGDLRALELVRIHFDTLTEVIRSHRGAVVKTIGDAVMAAFSEPQQAVAAAAAMSRAVRAIDGDGESLALKVGVHAGSCVAIQTNHQIDYFGTAVNTAARVQGVARGGEIVVSETIWNASGVPALVAASGLHVTPDRVNLRGIAAPVSVFRLH